MFKIFKIIINIPQHLYTSESIHHFVLYTRSDLRMLVYHKEAETPSGNHTSDHQGSSNKSDHNHH